ncbi:hypothetical protein AB7254_19415, partial [Providencia rettgeri]
SLRHLCCSEVSISPLFRWPNLLNHYKRIRGYQAVGISKFIFSGYPHLEEAHRFAELVMPLLQGLKEFSFSSSCINTGPFGETIANDSRPK